MPISYPNLITAMDAKISRFQQIRGLLAGVDSTGPRKRKHTMSAAARARISAAQKKRWAKRKKAAKR